MRVHVQVHAHVCVCKVNTAIMAGFVLHFGSNFYFLTLTIMTSAYSLNISYSESHNFSKNISEMTTLLELN